MKCTTSGIFPVSRREQNEVALITTALISIEKLVRKGILMMKKKLLVFLN